MSQVKIQGNPVGTGTFTIASPNTNTDRTLTLPDATGTVVLNEGSGTFSIRPSGSVQIGSTTGANPQLFVYTNSSTEPGIQVRQDGSAAIQVWAGLSGVERMRIDNAGRVTTPFQPSFSAGSVVGTGSVVSTSPMTLPAQVNVGGHYNATNGRFTAPVAGVYFFALTVLKNGTAASNFNIRVNGTDRFRGYANPTNDETAAIAAPISLNAGDYVDATAATSYYQDYSQFCGFLIG